MSRFPSSEPAPCAPPAIGLPARQVAATVRRRWSVLMARQSFSAVRRKVDNLRGGPKFIALLGKAEELVAGGLVGRVLCLLAQVRGSYAVERRNIPGRHCR